MSHTPSDDGDPRAGAKAVAWVMLILIFLLPFWCWIGWNISNALKW